MIIAISGKIGSGKTALAKAILECDPEFQCVPIAEALKCIVARATGIMNLDDQDAKNRQHPGSVSPGELLQFLGETMREVYGPVVHIERVYRKYGHLPKIVIPDLRYREEVAFLQSWGLKHQRKVTLVRMDGSYTGPGDRDPNHSSETDLDTFENWFLRIPCNPRRPKSQLRVYAHICML